MNKNIGNKNNLCRTCLSDIKKEAVSLFSIFKNSSIFSHINSIANINITENDNLPNKICSQCLSELEVAVSFKVKCEQNNLSLLNSTPNISTDDFDLDIKPEELREEKTEPEYLDEQVLEEDASFPVHYDSTHADQFSDSEVKYDSTHADQFSDSEVKYDSTQADEFSDSELKYEEDEKKPSTLEQEKTFKSNTTDLQCEDCKGIFKSKCKLRVHWKKVHMPAQLVCQTCKRAFKSYRTYNRHQKIKTSHCTECKHFRIEGLGKLRKFYCRECNYTSKKVEHMISHRVTHTGERRYACDLCGQGHTQQSSLISHKESAHGEYRYMATCQFCGKVFKGRGKFKSHLRIHQNHQIQCEICKIVLKTKEILKVHMLRHAEVKTKQCDLCTEKFFTNTQKFAHKNKVHFKIPLKSYACDVCDYKTGRKAFFVKHKTKHVGENVCCVKCGKFFENKEKLINHEWVHNKNFMCECGQKFYKKSRFQIHINKKHAKIEVPESSGKRKTPVQKKDLKRT